MNIKNLLKKIPAIRNYIDFHNPGMMYLIRKSGIFSSEAPLVIDVGANFGQTIEMILANYPASEIYSFEPTPELVNNLNLKYTDDKRVHIVDYALSDISGMADFYTSSFSPTNSLLKPNLSLYNEYEKNLGDILSESVNRKCKTCRLDEWYDINFDNHKVIDLIKIDTQGSEYKVLNGAKSIIQTHIKSVAVELQYLPFYVNSDPFYKTMEFLHKNGYYLYSFFENNKRSDLQLIENSALFINRRFSIKQSK